MPMHNRYHLARCGASFGQQCGPKIIAREPSALAELSHSPLAVPGNTTSAYLALCLFKPGLRTMLLPFDKIIPAVQMAVVRCALVVHEELSALEQAGLCCLVDLAQWWATRNDSLPLPLGCYGIRSDVAEPARRQIEDILRQSIRYALDHHDDAVAYAASKTGQTPVLAQQYIKAYVTDLSVDMGDRGRSAIEKFLAQGHEAGLIPSALPLQLA